jgi:hypothetical protein
VKRCCLTGAAIEVALAANPFYKFMNKKNKKCLGCEQNFTTSTANNEKEYCSQLCEDGKYKQSLKRLKG